MKVRAIALWALIAGLGVAVWYGITTVQRREGPREARVLLQEQPLRHLGIIMDGNRRWARQRGYKPWLGHRAGVGPAKAAVKFCLEQGIAYLTLYVLSLENLQRPAEELNYLFTILAQELAATEFEQLIERGVRVQYFGVRSAMPDSVVTLLDSLVEKSAHNSNLHLQLLFCGGGTHELVAAVQSCCDEVRAGTAPAQCTAEWLERHLWSGSVPPIDLIVRTGGQKRISNFLLYKSAYSDLYFLDCLWPDLIEDDLVGAVRFYARCRRTFGK